MQHNVYVIHSSLTDYEISIMLNSFINTFRETIHQIDKRCFINIGRENEHDTRFSYFINSQTYTDNLYYGMIKSEYNKNGHFINRHMIICSNKLYEYLETLGFTTYNPKRNFTISKFIIHRTIEMSNDNECHQKSKKGYWEISENLSDNSRFTSGKLSISISPVDVKYKHHILYYLYGFLNLATYYGLLSYDLLKSTIINDDTRLEIINVYSIDYSSYNKFKLEFYNISYDCMYILKHYLNNLKFYDHSPIRCNWS